MIICNYDKCTGCSACKHICPSGSISMTEDEYGEPHPRIDGEKCRSCGLCQQVCPVQNPPKFHRPVKAYICFAAENESRTKSASGGVAGEFYRYVLSEKDYEACGVMFDEKMELGYYWITPENIDMMRNSKYTFSNPNNIYQEVLWKLQEGKKVLFIGMPCQVAALKKFLINDFDNLITVDIICHGMPPFAYFREYLNDFKARTGKQVTNALFRDKKFRLKFKNGNKTVYQRSSRKDRYFAGYTSMLYYREACYCCQFANMQRAGDITIGDYFGVLRQNIKSVEKGISAVLLNTEKGMDFFDLCRERFSVRLISVRSVVTYNDCLRHPSNKNPFREEFLTLYSKNGYIAASDIVIRKIIKANRKKYFKNSAYCFLRKIYYFLLSFCNGEKTVKIGTAFRKKFRNDIDRKRLVNKDFSILSNNCISGVISSDLGVRFNSPTVNLYMTPSDFVKMIEQLEYYLDLEITELNSDLDYPVGRLGDITLYFKHYDTFEEACQKWHERKKRIRFDNLYLMMSDRWCCPYSVLQRFEQLPYKHKVCFTAKEYPEFSNCRTIHKNNDQGVCVGIITHITNIFGKRLYQYAENFDYIAFLNSKGE